MVLFAFLARSAQERGWLAAADDAGATIGFADAVVAARRGNRRSEGRNMNEHEDRETEKGWLSKIDGVVGSIDSQGTVEENSEDAKVVGRSLAEREETQGMRAMGKIRAAAGRAGVPRRPGSSRWGFTKSPASRRSVRDAGRRTPSSRPSHDGWSCDTSSARQSPTQNSCTNQRF